MFRCSLFILHHGHQESNIMKKKTEKTLEEQHEMQILKDEEVDQVVEGASFGWARCPNCGSAHWTMRDGCRICDGCGCKY